MIEKVIHYRSRIGMEIARREFVPVESEAIRGGVVLLHGIGEHTARYGEVMRRLTDRGVVCAGVDWPGHGISPGKRGHIDSLETVHTLVRETAAHVRVRLQESGTPPVIGLVAHSMGALLALDFLGRFPGDFAFAWVNAPPLDPGGKRGRAYIGFARSMEALFPRWTVHNGVKPSMCFDTGDRELALEARKFCHSRISLRLGLTLLKTARRVRDSSHRFNESLQLFVTQGGADPVCSPRLTRAWFETLDLGGKTYREFPDQRHECWRAEEVVQAAVEWMDGRLGG
jgi:alpha-beta hydrolase superfamily lysophospholipase